jgi:hypothetical protein
MARAKKVNPVLAALKRLGPIKVLLLSLVGLVGAGMALILAISGIARLGSPSVALAMLPNDGVALGAQADILIQGKPTNPPREVLALAMAALRNQAINPRAVRVLGFYTEVTGEFADAERLVRMAERLSRRESQGQMWLVEASARRNDTRQTLVHYDYALRVRPDNRQVLFPRLARAISDADIRTALKPYIRARNGWGEAFINYAIDENMYSPALASLMVESGGVANRKSNQILQVTLLGQLVNGGHYTDARRLYLSMAGSKEQRLSSVAFDGADRTGSHGPIGWQSFDNVDGSGGVRDETKTLVMEVFASAANTLPVMRKLLFLKPGSYSFSATLSRLETDPGGYLRWQIRCMQGTQGVTVWTVDGVEKNIRSNFSIAENCPVQLVEIIASGGQGQAGIDATISRMQLTALR